MRVHFDADGRPDDVGLDDDVGLVLAALERLAAEGVVSAPLRRLLTVVRTVSTNRMNESAQRPGPLTCDLSAVAHEWLAPDEVAATLGVSVATARRFCERHGQMFKERWWLVEREVVEREWSDRVRSGGTGGAPAGSDVRESAPESGSAA